ncbi:MAG: FliM/FliN family flagellar motor switch protein [Puniceicoccales bacterium]|jgi:flagellar motor switch/type III secretory pathway protein FliN|nr:FliM/FliN family flagellar motor switch protein [Puniceicoccales bacterium]
MNGDDEIDSDEEDSMSSESIDGEENGAVARIDLASLDLFEEKANEAADENPNASEDSEENEEDDDEKFGEHDLDGGEGDGETMDGKEKETMDLDFALSPPSPTAESPGSPPLATPPKSNPNEKVDTSKLDAELAKMRPSPSKNIRSTPLNSETKQGDGNVPTGNEMDENFLKNSDRNDDMDKENEEDDGDEESFESSNNEDEDETLGDEDADMDDGEADTSKLETQETIGEVGAEVPIEEGEIQGNEAIGEVGAEVPIEEGEVQGNEAIGEVGAEAPTEEGEIQGNEAIGEVGAEAPAEEGEVQGNETIGVDKSGPDPDFAEKVTEDIHSDEKAPQTEPISTEYAEPLAVQKIDYREPEISSLNKQPTLSKETAIHSSVPLEKMPIVLTFETGRQKITIGELEKIKEGYTFECGNPANSPVTICANDTPIGTGELLDIDGRIGVRVIEFYNK